MQKAYKTPTGSVVSVAHGQKTGFVLVVTTQSRRNGVKGYINNLKIGKKSFHFDDFEAAEHVLDQLAAKNGWKIL